MSEIEITRDYEIPYGSIKIYKNNINTQQSLDEILLEVGLVKAAIDNDTEGDFVNVTTVKIV